MWGDIGSTAAATRASARHREIWGDMGRYGEIWGDTGRYREHCSCDESTCELTGLLAPTPPPPPPPAPPPPPPPPAAVPRVAAEPKLLPPAQGWG